MSVIVFFEQIPVDVDGYVYGSTIKFARMVSFNEVFTVFGLKSAPKKTSAKKSQCVDDYIDHVEDIKIYFASHKETLEKYKQLTIGYQKVWARYVYSTKKNETQEKRLQEMMMMILTEGDKSKDLYRKKGL
ncbi:hypothetical protein H4683_001779 [Filibacter limicola]|uniref:Uncharacterized protein n=1 Tax=Sporosarcina limicola TaxID=34101 RepID=A0A927R358_9BACL|nr:YdeI/OmpD-associated family protein [Sporosarcina limicola]MBE1554701.1 hypothetical protein [Sporosarcina limicola]